MEDIAISSVARSPQGHQRSLACQTEGLLEPLHKIEMPLVRVLADMEAIGVAVDEDRLKSER